MLNVVAATVVVSGVDEREEDAGEDVVDGSGQPSAKEICDRLGGSSGESMDGMGCYQTKKKALEVASNMCCNSTCCSGGNSTSPATFRHTYLGLKLRVMYMYLHLPCRSAPDGAELPVGSWNNSREMQVRTLP